MKFLHLRGRYLNSDWGADWHLISVQDIRGIEQREYEAIVHTSLGEFHVDDIEVDWEAIANRLEKLGLVESDWHE